MTNKITLKRNVKIINDEYVIKKKKHSLKSTYNYLLSRSFDYFPEIVKEDDNYLYFKYIRDVSEPAEQKMIDLLILLSILHSKTTFYKEVDLDYYKSIYEDINKKIDDVYNYYNNLMDTIDNEIFMSPANYLIARNITLVYNSLNYAKENIELWYEMIENKHQVRLVTIHNNLSLDHYLKSDKPYLISWDNAKTDMPIYDLVTLYQNHALDFEFIDILKIYLNKFPLSNEEMLLFFILISIPDKIKAMPTEYETTISISSLLDYLTKTKILREEYRIKQKTNKSSELQKQDQNIDKAR